MLRTLVTTGDGSPTLYVPSLKEHYHSTFGAFTESMHVFIETGLKHILPSRPEISVFEMGFGTGLNAWLTALEAEKTGCRIHYTAIESEPLDSALTAQLKYNELMGLPDDGMFGKLHESSWNETVQLTPSFDLQKIHADFSEFDIRCSIFDLVYFDAFGPEVQPELWLPEVFYKIAASMKPGGVLVTYSVKGSVKRALKSAGLTIEKLPGPPGKREILRALKPY